MPDDDASPQDWSKTLATMAGVLFSYETLDDLLGLVVSLAASSLPDAEVSLTLRRNGDATTTNATSSSVRDADAAQYDSGRGPCLVASFEGDLVYTAVEPEDPRWPEFSRRAAELGFRTVLSAPIHVRGRSSGAVNCYSSRRAAFGPHEQEMAQLFAKQASILLSNAVQFMQAERLNEQLTEALETRETIGQAKGIIMAREGVGPDDAFDILRRASQRANRKLRDIAAEVVRSASPPPPPEH